MAKPATREQVATFGPIAARLREVLKARDWKPYDLNKAIGRDAGHASAYQWINSKGAPGRTIRAKVAKVTGIAEADLMPRRPGAPPVPTTAVATLPAPAKLAPVRVGDVLSFAVSADGAARLRLDIVLPLATATPLLRMLLDAGIVFGAEPAG